MAEKKKYMNPITFEAEIFVSNLEILSKTYHNIDSTLVSSLEKVMRAIETFLDSNPSEIVATNNIELVRCDELDHIKRMYHCNFCKLDLGKSIENTTYHIIENCKKRCVVDKPAISRTKEDELQSIRKELKAIEKPFKNEPHRDQANKLNKKTRNLLTSDLSRFIDDNAKISLKLKCLPAYDKIVRDLTILITPLFPKQNVKIYKFGSRIAGIGNRESDLDLYIDIGDTFNVFQSRFDLESLLKLNKVALALQNNSLVWKGLVKIDKARVPILKTFHIPTGIECDINFSNSLGTINTNYLEFIFNLQPIANLLCIFMKKWLNFTKINEEINTYSMSLMVLFYLQIEKVIPSVKQLQKDINEERALKVGRWLCTYATLTLNDLQIQKERLDQPNMLKFIRGFFQFYTDFNFNRDVICPYLGDVFSKSELAGLMPDRYHTIIKSSSEFPLHVNRPIVVQDPIQLNHNTTKCISEYTLNKLRSYMLFSLEALNETFL